MSAMKEMLKALCNDPKCLNPLCFSKLKNCIDCFKCGQQHKVQLLLNIQDVEESEKEWVVKNLLRQLQIGIPKRNAEFIKVIGLSNYYCKLLSPFLTHYGMDNKTGKPMLLSDLNQGEILDCGVFSDRAFLIAPHQISIPGFGRDETGSVIYLSETLNLIKSSNGGEERLVPIHTDGDGHCLVHAISRSLVGRELFWHPLRCALKRHFENNLDKYKELFKDFIDTDEWPYIIDECDPDFKPPDGELHGLRNIHTFGLANVLKRPIILLDSLDCMKKSGDYSALFLPGFVSPDGCRGRDNTLNKPICIAWSSFSHNHYIPLVGVQNKPLPVLPMSLVPKAWGIPQSQVFQYIECDSNDNCVIGGNRSLSDAYVLRLVTAMEELFYEINRIHPSIVADAKLYLCQSNAFMSTTVQTIVEVSKRCVQQGRLYRCHSCWALCELKIDSNNFRRGGELYSTLTENYHKLEPDVPYMLHGICCKYDPIGDSIIADLACSYLESCTWCKGSDVWRLNADGSETDVKKISSYTPPHLPKTSIIPNTSSQIAVKISPDRSDATMTSESVKENTDDICVPEGNGTLVPNYKVPSERSNITVKLSWNGRSFSHMLSWSAFQKSTGENLNNAVKQLASELIHIHYPEEINDANLWPYVELEIRRTLEKFSASDNHVATIHEATNDFTSDTSNVQYVKLVSSKGDQINLSLGEKGVTFQQLQTFIDKKFDIPVRNQVIKIGFPPKELEIPLRNNRPLAIKHGDRLTIESQQKPTSQKTYSYSNTPYNRNPNLLDREDSKLERDVVWKIAIATPEDFRKGGCYYDEVTQKHILTDMTHVSIDCFPFKSFSYNKDSDCLELCEKRIGHFEISPDLDNRISQASKGQTPKGFRKCSYMSVSKEPIIVRTMKKAMPITQGSDSSLASSLIRKGPGFSILRTPDDDMDVA